MKHIDAALERIDLTLAEGDPLAGLTAMEVARVALDGLRMSVELGYMLEDNARAMYAHHFPGCDYDPALSD